MIIKAVSLTSAQNNYQWLYPASDTENYKNVLRTFDIECETETDFQSLLMMILENHWTLCLFNNKKGFFLGSPDVPIANVLWREI